jgi:hypothetical protein
MSATSITVRNRENVYKKLESQLLDQGNLYILEREFKLGDGINKTKVDYLRQYTSLLCNDNCDINSLIETKIKGLEELDCETKISFQMELSRLSDQYYEWLNEGNSGNFLEYILQTANISSCVAWNQTGW